MPIRGQAGCWPAFCAFSAEEYLKVGALESDYSVSRPSSAHDLEQIAELLWALISSTDTWRQQNLFPRSAVRTGNGAAHKAQRRMTMTRRQWWPQPLLALVHVPAVSIPLPDGGTQPAGGRKDVQEANKLGQTVSPPLSRGQLETQEDCAGPWQTTKHLALWGLTWAGQLCSASCALPGESQ